MKKRSTNFVSKSMITDIKKEISSAIDNNFDVLREHYIKHYPNINYELIASIHGKINALRGIFDFIIQIQKDYEV